MQIKGLMRTLSFIQGLALLKDFNVKYTDFNNSFLQWVMIIVASQWKVILENCCELAVTLAEIHNINTNYRTVFNITGSINGLMSAWCQANTMTNIDGLIITYLGSHFNMKSFENKIFYFKKINFKIASVKLLTFCPRANDLNHCSLAWVLPLH